MASNKNALIRYKTIDKCLQNRFRKWTLNDLIEACSDALYEFEGKDVDVSKRTIQLDIQNMRSDKFGYNAPIIVVDRKFYTYEEEKYSITNLPISNQDLEKLAESVEFLKQFRGFTHFDELQGVIQKLEDHVYSKQTKTTSVIEFEKNDHLKGLHFLNKIYQTIIKRETIQITYQSFKARTASTFIFNAYLLKEYRNRWFVVGIRKNQKHLVNLALDRIIEIKDSDDEYVYNNKYDLSHFFSKAIGVSVNPNLKTEEIKLFVNHKHAPYVLTKPFHFSQKIVEKNLHGYIISLDVQHNFELEKLILGMGESMKVISPPYLKRRIFERTKYAVDNYITELEPKNIKNQFIKFSHTGSVLFNFIYPTRHINKIKTLIHAYKSKKERNSNEIDNLIEKIPELESFIFSENLKNILLSFVEDYQLTSVCYYKKLPPYVKEKEWFQLNKKGFSIRIHLNELKPQSNNFEVILKTQKKLFSDDEIDFISENSLAYDCLVKQGGIHILNHQLIRRMTNKKQNHTNHVIELRFE